MKHRSANPGSLVIVIAVLVLIVCVGTASAQMEIGDNLKLKLNGSTGFSYMGGYGNQATSSHGTGFLFDFNGSGYYFHPNFLSFDFHPYYNRSQTNSESQTLTAASGVGASANIFSGSHFPVTVSYGKDFGSSNFRVGGVPTVTTDSASQVFSVGVSENLPDLPQVSVNFSKGSASSSFVDLGDSKTSTTNLNLTAGYRLSGWNIQSGLSHNNSSFSSPAYVTATTLSGETSGTSYYASTGHSLPLRGSVGFGWGHSTADSSTGYNYGTTNYTISNTFNPLSRLSLFQNVNYVTNLSGLLLQGLGTAVLTPTKIDYNSYGMTYGTGASYYLGKGISAGGYYNYRYQHLEDKAYTGSQYGGNINFQHASRLFGFLNFGLGVADTAGVNGNNGAGINANVGASKRFGHWETAADFIYSQNVMTLGTIATTSNYSYGGNVRRRVNRDLSFGGSYRSAHSGFVTQQGDSSSSNSYNGQFQWRGYTFGGGYSMSDGSAVLTSSGTLVPVPGGGTIFIPDLMLFNAKSYNGSASATILRRLTISGGYSNFTSDTRSSKSGTLNSGSSFNTTMQYRLRKFQFGGGYSHTQQETSVVAGGPRVLNSFYVSFSRWFNVF